MNIYYRFYSDADNKIYTVESLQFAGTGEPSEIRVFGKTFYATEGELLFSFGDVDCDGDRIFLGDILKMSQDWNYEVIFNPSKCRLSLRSMHYVHKPGERPRKAHQRITKTAKGKIIGNVYFDASRPILNQDKPAKVKA